VSLVRICCRCDSYFEWVTPCLSFATTSILTLLLLLLPCTASWFLTIVTIRRRCLPHYIVRSSVDASTPLTVNAWIIESMIWYQEIATANRQYIREFRTVNNVTFRRLSSLVILEVLASNRILSSFLLFLMK